MCLIVQSREPKIAEEDIICYKLVKYWEDADVYVSPLQHFPIASSRKIIGFIQKDDSDYSRVYPGIITRKTLDYNVGGGFLHTFMYLKSAKYIISKVSNKSEYRIFKCIVPKGVKYYEGYSKSTLCGNIINVEGLASKELIYKEEIPCV